ncbi:MAG: hypothetical protein RJA07_1400 [Bacteroidota bacterium]|jgi:uncharacterized repeat protein (TIGR01451 family)
MKKIFTLLLLLAMMMSKNTKAQWYAVPDTNFRNYLINLGYGAGFNNTLDSINSNAPVVLSVQVLSITVPRSNTLFNYNIAGIKAFKNLNLLYLTASNNYINNLPAFFITELPDSLKDLYCSDIQIDTFYCPLPANLKTLDCSTNFFSSLPQIPSSLTGLFCSYNHLTSLPTLPYSLSILDCSNNNLTNLPILHSSLTDLYCSYNHLNSLPVLPSSLINLNCQDNQLSILPTLPNSLIIIKCSYNQLNSLPALPSSLTDLDCSNNQIISLPALPSSLAALDCSNNQISNLLALPSPLTYLFCSNNQLDSLPILPFSLRDLACYNNQLNRLPPLPLSLLYLSCDNNQLNNLPILPSALTSIGCSYNQLNALPVIPTSLNTLNCSYNQLSCLPDLKNINSLVCSGNPISCLPNYGWNNQLYSTYHALYPICGLLTTCALYWNITGTIFMDKNSSCIYDATDTVLKNIKVELWRNGILEQQTYSRPDGTYSFDVNIYDTFQIKIDTTNLPYYLSCSNQQVLTSIISATDSTDFNMNFGMQCKLVQNDIETKSILTNRHRIGRLNNITFNEGFTNSIYGYNCASSNISGKVKLFKNGPVKFKANTYYSTQPSIISDDSLIWNVADFNTFPANLNLSLQVDTTAQIGQSVCYTLVVVPNTPDANPHNDTLHICFPIMSGYDPNVKTAQLNVNDSTINYTIQFQNTGNDTAINIIVRDTLSNQLDVASLQITGYSHQPVTQTFGNKIVFNFPQINLVDSSTNEPLSHGFVSFKVKVLPTVTTNSIVPNQAAIYFDFNPAIYTNTTQTSICYHPSFATINANICPIQAYTFNNHSLTAAGIYFDTLVNYVGCDSIVQLNLNITNTKRDMYKTICNGSSYFFNGKNRNANGMYKDTVLMGIGCDSLITLHLTVLPIIRTTKFTTICSSDSIYFNAHYIKKSGLYKDTLIGHLGCDSIATIILTVLGEIHTSISQISCANHPFYFNNQLLTNSGIYYDTLQSYMGCDSFITMNFTNKPISQTTLTQSICSNQSYSFKNKTLTASGIYIDTLTNYLGCDSFVILHFTIKPIKQTTLTQGICSNQSFQFNHHALTQSGIYYDTLQTYLGCDSFITLHFTIKPISQTTLTQSICSNQSFSFNNHHLTSSGIYYDTLTNYVGCDSIVMLHFTYHLISNKIINQTICNNQTYLFKNQQLNSGGTYYDTLPNSNGCDSFITLHLIVLPTSSSSIYHTLCSGQSYYFNNHLINVGGTFKDTLQNYVGCDSIITLHLIVNPTTASGFTHNICYGDVFHFNQHNYNQSGTYFDTLTNYVGCDSVVVMNLVVLPYNHTFVNASFCRGDIYNFNGKPITINGIYDDTLIAANGCDSAITLLIAMKIADTAVHIINNSLVATASNSYFQWIDCSTHQHIVGATDSIFYPSSSGNYAVVVQSKQNLCTDTSACYTFGNVGVGQLANGIGQLMLYPNPCAEKLIVMNDKSQTFGIVNTIEVTNLLGQLQNVIVEKLTTNDLQLTTENLLPGIYFIKAIDTKGNIINGKFLKE